MITVISTLILGSIVCIHLYSSFTSASSINMFFIEKIHNIKMEFPLLEACLPAYSFVDIDTIMPVCTAVFDTFQPHSCDVLASIIHKLNRTEHDCDLGHCSYDSDSSLQKPLNNIEYNGLYIIINMFSKDCCAIFHWHYFTFSHKKNISETVPNSVHIGECTIPVLNIYIYIYLHFKYKIEISHNKNILIYKSSRIMISNDYLCTVS